MQRACAAALLRQNTTIIHQPGHSNDDKAALGVIRDLGAAVTTLENGSLTIQSKGVNATEGLQVDCGESGLGLRMFAPIMGLSSTAVSVIGHGSLLNRPMDFFDEIFPQLGIRVKSNHGKLPLVIQGPLQPRDIEIDGSLSSQFLTGLLLAFYAAKAKGVTITVRQLRSKPYIDLTLQVMRHFGWHVENRNYEAFYFAGEHSGVEKGSLAYTVEGDWSGGAFLLVAGAIAGPITIRGLDTWSTQADKAILQAICDTGAPMTTAEDEITIGPGPLKAFRFNATDCPDLFPPLVALASNCDGTSAVTGVSRLAHKESNRGLTLKEEFGKMGISIDLVGDTMLIRGGVVNGATVHSRHDHRIAMACAVAALKARGAVTIEEAQAIDKSYPDFYRDLQQLGAALKLHL
jgi:3-phosphoshikimate 1-carboxyvinyltransferase